MHKKTPRPCEARGSVCFGLAHVVGVEHGLVNQQLGILCCVGVVHRIGVRAVGHSGAAVGPLGHIDVHAVIGVTREGELVHAIGGTCSHHIAECQLHRVGCAVAGHVDVGQLREVGGL